VSLVLRSRALLETVELDWPAIVERQLLDPELTADDPPPRRHGLVVRVLLTAMLDRAGGHRGRDALLEAELSWGGRRQDRARCSLETLLH
jgi:hypothetical protein